MFAYAKPEQKQATKSTVQKKETENKSAPNLTGIPDKMKTNFENYSGFSFSDVRIHYNSDKPTQLQALAYTQGNQVYVAPGQEKHLGHELGHVVQQKERRVKPTTTVNGFAVNDNDSLEREADNYENIQYSRASHSENASGSTLADCTHGVTNVGSEMEHPINNASTFEENNDDLQQYKEIQSGERAVMDGFTATSHGDAPIQMVHSFGFRARGKKAPYDARKSRSKTPYYYRWHSSEVGKAPQRVHYNKKIERSRYRTTRKAVDLLQDIQRFASKRSLDRSRKLRLRVVADQGPHTLSFISSSSIMSSGYNKGLFQPAKKSLTFFQTPDVAAAEYERLMALPSPKHANEKKVAVELYKMRYKKLYEIAQTIESDPDAAKYSPYNMGDILFFAYSELEQLHPFSTYSLDKKPSKAEIGGKGEMSVDIYDSFGNLCSISDVVRRMQIAKSIDPTSVALARSNTLIMAQLVNRISLPLVFHYGVGDARKIAEELIAST